MVWTMTDDLSEEQHTPPESGDDEIPEAEDSSRRIDDLLSQNLWDALIESRQRKIHVSGDAAPQAADSSFSWTDSAEEQQARRQPVASEPVAAQPMVQDDVPEESGTSLLDFDEVVRSDQDEEEGKSSLLQKFFPLEEEEERSKRPAQESILGEESRSLWQRFWRWIYPSQAMREKATVERFLLLDDAIYREPAVAVNYVIRGELYLQRGEIENAAADFEQGEELAHSDFAESRWGLVAQATRDRARRGLEMANKQRRHLRASSSRQ
jgi:hypothetical protein